MENGWFIRQEGWEPDKTELSGSKFTIANGYFGYRGTLEEFGKEQLVALTLSELYDDSGSGWREIINAPNPLYTTAEVEGFPLSVLSVSPLIHEQTLLLDAAEHRRKTVFSLPEGKVTVESRRFASADDIHLLCMRYVVRADFRCTVTLRSGFDRDIWELNGPHYEEAQYSGSDGGLLFHGVTVENKYAVSIMRRVSVFGKIRRDGYDSDTEVFKLELSNNEPAGIDLFCAICKSTDCIDTKSEAAKLSTKALEAGIDMLFLQHKSVWEKRWRDFDVLIEGDNDAQLALRYSIFLLTSAAPFYPADIALPARGLSGQVYKGAMFWDTELYFMPIFLCCAPKTAKNFVRYRIRNLEGARQKAAEEGYQGAFYPWESQETGKEGCTYYNLKDVFTGRSVRTYFRDRQIHISADVAYGILSYANATADEGLLVDGGMETLIECAEFFWSFAYWKPDKGRLELLEVTGPDEYHERVNNNAYTNAMAKMTAQGALWASDLIKNKYPKIYCEFIRRHPDFEKKCLHAKLLAEYLYVPQARSDDGVIPQYDGFFKKEDCSLEELKSRIIKENEYLGSPVGLAAETQIAKQADVVLMLTVLASKYPDKIKKANWDYYEPRCEHGSSLSTCIYALLAALTGRTDWAYKYFMRAAQTDLSGNYKLYLGSLYIGGTHPAANGGSWMVAVQGFGGLSIRNDCVVIEPHLPSMWTSLKYRFTARGQWFMVTVRADFVRIEADAANTCPIIFCNGKERRICKPHEEVSFTLYEEETIYDRT